jgi:hypothetical protein
MIPFPNIPDDDLKAQLVRLVAKRGEKTIFSFSSELSENEFYVFPKESLAHRCVRLLGSHMLDIEEVIYQIIELNQEADGK